MQGLRRPSKKINPQNRPRLLRAAALLRDGKLLAHATSTVPGIAATPFDAQALERLQRFKQRQGPFLLLADDAGTARRWARWIPRILRLAIRQSWPGSVTLVYPGRPGLMNACYQKGKIAVRVDTDAACRQLAKLNGGLIISSSLNRRGQTLQSPDRRLRMRWHRYLQGAVPADIGRKNPSRLMVWRAGRLHVLR